MGYEQERADIESHFDTEWANATPVAWENVKFTPTQGQSWVALSILNASETNISINGDQYRNVGIVDVGVFTPEGTGSKGSKDLVDSVASIFRGQRVGDAVFKAPSVTVLGLSNGWYQTTVTIPFWRDNIIS